jgi:hypothetical protein
MRVKMSSQVLRDDLMTHVDLGHETTAADVDALEISRFDPGSCASAIREVRKIWEQGNETD